MKNTYQEVVIGDKTHKIVTGTYPEQCKGYYEALNRGDGYAAHMLHLPYVTRDIRMVQFEIDMLVRSYELQKELERINELPENLQRIEMELRLKK